MQNCQINASTTIYGLVGYPVSHSLSPRFWNNAFQYLGINSVYLAFPVESLSIESSLAGLRDSGVKGINVTRPHKVAAAKFCNLLQGAAKDTGIVNSIKFSKDYSEGYNTDATGCLKLLNRLNLPKTRALVLGDGATSISVIWALEKFGMTEIHQIARKFSDENPKNEKNIRKFSWNSKNFTNSIQLSDIIINTTAVGWQKDDNIPELNLLIPSKTYIDFNYSSESRLLATARERCAKVIDGRELLYEQGLEAFNLLTNCAPPADVIRSSIFD